MVFYPRDPYGGPRSPMYSQRGGTGPVPSMRRQDEAYFYPNEMRRPNEAYFYPNQRRQEEAYPYPNQRGRQGEGYMYPDHRRRQEELYYQNQMRRQDEAYFHPNGMPGPNHPPMAGPNQPQNRRPPSRLPEQLNNLAGHMGTITQGINIMRQVGSLLSMFNTRR